MTEIGPQIMRARTKTFALRIIKLFRTLSNRADAQVLGKQLLRCGTAVAANYRAACRSRSRAEFIAKIGVVVEEADESMLWIELLGEAGIVPPPRLEALHQEARELTAIFTATRQSTRARRS
ncbi:MAG TPA: four helix bundle protein [Terriglobales bacterium]|jgi:four helix bundle protein|nr:four helix bundle protein [Terriglobales bacterium]